MIVFTRRTVVTLHSLFIYCGLTCLWFFFTFSVSLGIFPPKDSFDLTEEEMNLIQATDMEEATFAVPTTWEKELLDVEETPSSIIVGVHEQAQLASQEILKAPEVMIPACTPPTTSTSQISFGPYSQPAHRKTFPSPLKRASQPRKRRSKTATAPFIPPLLPHLSRSFKAKSRKPHYPLHTVKSKNKILPLMSIKTGYFLPRSRVLEILSGIAPKAIS